MSSKIWNCSWYHFSDCYCIWKGERRQGGSNLWEKIEDNPQILIQAANGNTDRLLEEIGGIVDEIGPRESWEPWPQELEFRICVLGTDAKYPDAKAFLSPKCFYLVLSEAALGKAIVDDYGFKREEKDGKVTCTFDFLQNPIPVPTLEETETLLELGHFMEGIDNQLLSNDDQFRRQIAQNPTGVRNEIESRLGTGFLRRHKAVGAFTITEGALLDTEFASDGAQLKLKISIPEANPTAAPKTSEDSFPKIELLVADWPCGNIPPPEEDSKSSA